MSSPSLTVQDLEACEEHHCNDQPARNKGKNKIPEKVPHLPADPESELPNSGPSKAGLETAAAFFFGGDSADLEEHGACSTYAVDNPLFTEGGKARWDSIRLPLGISSDPNKAFMLHSTSGTGLRGKHEARNNNRVSDVNRKDSHTVFEVTTPVESSRRRKRSIADVVVQSKGLISQVIGRRKRQAKNLQDLQNDLGVRLGTLHCLVPLQSLIHAARGTPHDAGMSSPMEAPEDESSLEQRPVLSVDRMLGTALVLGALESRNIMSRTELARAKERAAAAPWEMPPGRSFQWCVRRVHSTSPTLTTTEELPTVQL